MHIRFWTPNHFDTFSIDTLQIVSPRSPFHPLLPRLSIGLTEHFSTCSPYHGPFQVHQPLDYPRTRLAPFTITGDHLCRLLSFTALSVSFKILPCVLTPKPKIQPNPKLFDANISPLPAPPQHHPSYPSTLLHHLYPHLHLYSKRVPASPPSFSPSPPHTPVLPTTMREGRMTTLFPFPDPFQQVHLLSLIPPSQLHLLPRNSPIRILDFLSSFLSLSAKRQHPAG